MEKISDISAMEVLNSRCEWTIEVEVRSESGHIGRGMIPAGKSTGIWEAVPVSTKQAIENIHSKIKPKILGGGIDLCDQAGLDDFLLNLEAEEQEVVGKRDDVGPKYALGANSILGVSLAAARCAAAAQRKPLYRYLSGEGKLTLPVPQMNMINGGAHAGNNLVIQEFMLMPVGCETFTEAVHCMAGIYNELGKIIKEKYGASATNVGDEGGYTPGISAPGGVAGKDLVAYQLEEVMGLFDRAIAKAGYSFAKGNVMAGLDVAASGFYLPDKGIYDAEGGQLSTGELIDVYSQIVGKYPFATIEDPLQEEDYEGFAELTKRHGQSIRVIGDDLYVSNIERIKTGVEKGSANGLLLKVNQIGSLTEAIGAAKYAMDNGHDVFVSHRSGETEDAFISDLAASLNALCIKTGAPARSDRTAKYNRLLRIENDMAGNIEYRGKTFFK